MSALERLREAEAEIRRKRRVRARVPILSRVAGDASNPGRSAVVVIVSDRRRHRRTFTRTWTARTSAKRGTDTTAGDTHAGQSRNETRSRTNQTSPTPRRRRRRNGVSLERYECAAVVHPGGRHWVRGDVRVQPREERDEELLELYGRVRWCDDADADDGADDGGGVA